MTFETPPETRPAGDSRPRGATHAGSARFAWHLLVPSLVVWTTFGLAVLARLYGNAVWDDGYVFIRYAGNLLAHGTLSWNPGGPATYGLTSVGFGIAVAVVRIVMAHADPSVVAATASLAAGIVFLAGLGVWLDRGLPSSSHDMRHGAALVVWLAAAGSAGAFAVHCVSGMDTTFVLCGLTAYLAGAVRYERRPAARGALLLGLGGGLAWWVRPDLLLYTFAVPAALVIGARDRMARRAALRLSVVTLATAALVAGASAIYFHSALPLPFYAKVGRYYEDAVYAAHQRDPLFELRGYALECLPLLLLVVAHVAVSVVRKRRPFSALEWGLLGATVVFIVYYAGFVLQISAASHRFYFPTLPALVWLAGVSAVRLLESLPEARAPRTWFAAANPLAARNAAAGAILVALASAALAVPRVTALRAATAAAPFFIHNEARRHYAETWIRRTWFRLDAFSDLPDDVSMATTEFGYPAAMNPRKTIYDLSGLNDTGFAHHGFSADVLFQRDKPDVLFMPWRDYDRMTRQIYSHPSFAADYEAFTPEDLGTAMGLAIRLRSPYYARLKQIVVEGASRVRGRERR